MLQCKTCEALKAHNEYLQKLIDRLLVNQGAPPVYPQPIGINLPQRPDTIDGEGPITTDEVMRDVSDESR